MGFLNAICVDVVIIGVVFVVVAVVFLVEDVELVFDSIIASFPGAL